MWSFDVSEAVGKVRLLIPDREQDEAFFEDEEIEALIEMEGGGGSTAGIKRAAALGLETMASDQVMVLKVMKLMDVSTDGKAVSEGLLMRADKLRLQADIEEQGEEGGGFDIAELVVDDFSYRARLWNEGLRGG